MLSSLVPLILAPAILSADPAPLPAGTQLSFQGSVAQLQEDRTPAPPEKSFDLTLLVEEAGDSATQVLWVISERGRGTWPWTEHFGRLTLNENAQPPSSAGPRLLYDLGESTSVISIAWPMLAGNGPLKEGAEWKMGSLSYEVVPAPASESDSWKVEVHNQYGRQRTIWLDKEDGVVSKLLQRVFMGMGEEFQLELRRVGGTRQLPAEELAGARATFDALLDLRSRLKLRPGAQELNLNEEQIAAIKEHLPAIEEQTKGQPLDQVVRAARRDLELQDDRAQAVEKLVAEYQGSMAKPFTAEGLNRETVSLEDLQGHVTVLHFWFYRDAPLKEPYGQVGYLDFFAQHHQPDGVKVYGIAVDGRLQDQQQRLDALRGIRKLRSFMNLRYPILLDSGSLLKKFGDPRLVGADLPLFVVIGRDGKIVDYRVGFYEVDRNEGLKELNATVKAALGK